MGRPVDNVRVFFAPGPDCADNIIYQINSSDKIDIAVYSITDVRIADAIIMAHNRGANVRIITDRLQAHSKYSCVNKFRDVGIEIVTNVNNKIEHNKFAIFDERIVVTGSYNCTINAARYNSENCIFMTHTVPHFIHRFNQLWSIYSK